MNPNPSKTIEILTSKLATSTLEASQWQSIADDFREENEKLKREKQELKKLVEELENHIDTQHTPVVREVTKK